MKIQQLIDEQMKEFDMYFVKNNEPDVEPSFIDPVGSVGPIKQFILESVRKLIEAVGEEIAPDLADHSRDESNAYTVGWKDERKEMRYELKEIIRSLDK